MKCFFFTNIRLHTRTKYSSIKQAEQRSGINGLSQLKALSPLEERIIKITTKEAVDGDETPEVGFEQNPILDRSEILLAETIDDVVEQSLQEIQSDCENSGSVAANTATDVATTTSALLGRNSSAAATTRPRRRKRRTQAETPQYDKFFKIEERKVAEMEIANNLKKEQIAVLREQVEATKKQTEAIKAGTQAKEEIVAKLDNLIRVFSSPK